ncbi:hypothetical protein JB92DRAFT_2919031 [Gautieria morchelliformis]|nr:hypothetical protein JB92DRAFT_2919031 [Gautieria morchelliformis]
MHITYLIRPYKILNPGRIRKRQSQNPRVYLSRPSRCEEIGFAINVLLYSCRQTRTRLKVPHIPTTPGRVNDKSWFIPVAKKPLLPAQDHHRKPYQVVGEPKGTLGSVTALYLRLADKTGCLIAHRGSSYTALGQPGIIPSALTSTRRIPQALVKSQASYAEKSRCRRHDILQECPICCTPSARKEQQPKRSSKQRPVINTVTCRTSGNHLTHHIY